MNLSVFYAVRFSPAPELGEWLNVAVVGEGINERKAGVIVTDSLKRIEAAFGPEAVDRVRAISSDLSSLVAAMASAQGRGEETQPIPTAMRDHALSLSFSEQIVVFESSFEDALNTVAKKFLSSFQSTNVPPIQVQVKPANTEQDSDLSRIATNIQNQFARFTREILPATVNKSIEHGQKAIDSIVHGPEASIALVLGGAGHLGTALLPRLLASGKRVRLFDPSISGSAVVEILPQSADQGFSILEVAKKAGVSAESVESVLAGATEKLRVSPKTAERIRDIAAKLGHRSDASVANRLHSDDVSASMEGVDVVIYIPESVRDKTLTGNAGLTTAIDRAKTAKASGVQRFVFAGTARALEASESQLEQELLALGDDRFAVTFLHLGELYGHADVTTWYGDLHEPSTQSHGHPSVNALTAQAIINGKVSVVDSHARLFLHVEDAVESIMAVLDAPALTVNHQSYHVGSEDQILTAGEIAKLIKLQAPNTEFVMTAATGENALDPVTLSKIQDELGFTPNRSIESGIADLIKALQDGSVSKYMSRRTADPEAQVTASAPSTQPSDIQWDKLVERSDKTASQESASDQSRLKH